MGPGVYHGSRLGVRPLRRPGSARTRTSPVYAASTPRGRTCSSPPAEVIAAVDHNPSLYNRLLREVSGITVVENECANGASGTRNTGASLASTPYIAFLDDDAHARPGWLEGLLAPFEDPSVVGSGG